jgi:hypothetical protein
LSDLELLFLVTALLYGFECICWLRRGSVAFRTWIGRNWEIVQPGALLGNQKGGFTFAHPLPPLGTLFVGTQFPFTLTPDGVLAFIASSVNPLGRPAWSGRFFPFEQIRDIKASGRKVLIDRELAARTNSPTHAENLAQKLRELKELKVDAREQAIKKLLAETLNIEALKKDWDNFQERTSSLQLLTNILFVCLFFTTPWAIHRVGVVHTWPFLLGGLFVLTLSTALVFRRAHKALFPQASDPRFAHFMMIMLWPVAAIRSADMISRPLLETYHPLALAKVFCRDEQFAQFARFILREVRFPAGASGIEPANLERARQGTELWNAAVTKFLNRHGLKIEELLERPARADAESLSYCPRCLAQFTTRDGVCVDCGGLPLVPFAAGELKSK